MGLNNNYIPLADVLKFVEGQDDIVKVCKTLRECREGVLRLSLEDRRQLGKELVERFKAQSITLQGKTVKKYGEVVRKVVDGEWPVLEVQVPGGIGVVCPACSSSGREGIGRGG